MLRPADVIADRIEVGRWAGQLGIGHVYRRRGEREREREAERVRIPGILGHVALPNSDRKLTISAHSSGRLVASFFIRA